MFPWQQHIRHLNCKKKTEVCVVNLFAASFGDQRIKGLGEIWVNGTQVSKTVFRHFKFINKHCLFALAWHWHWCWHWHSCRPSYRVGQRPSLIRRRVTWGILRRVPWVLWSVVIRRLCWRWCTLCINWWLCCKYATKNLKQGSKIRSGLEKKCAVSYFTSRKCKYLPKQQRFTKHGNLRGNYTRMNSIMHTNVHTCTCIFYGKCNLFPLFQWHACRLANA